MYKFCYNECPSSACGCKADPLLQSPPPRLGWQSSVAQAGHVCSAADGRCCRSHVPKQTTEYSLPQSLGCPQTCKLQPLNKHKLRCASLQLFTDFQILSFAIQLHRQSLVYCFVAGRLRCKLWPAAQSCDNLTCFIG